MRKRARFLLSQPMMILDGVTVFHFLPQLGRAAIYFSALLTLFQPVLAAQESQLKNPPVKIGALFALSSWGAIGGQSELQGALLAQEDINARGGIDGHALEFVVEDCQSDAKKTVSAFRKLVVEDRVPAVVGPNWAEFTELVSPLAENYHTPFITPSGHPDGLFTSSKRYSFTLFPTQDVNVRPLVEYIKKSSLRKFTVAVSPSAYAESLLAAIRRAFAGDSRYVFEDPMRVNQEQADFRSIVTHLKRSTSDAMLLLLLENGGLATFLRNRQLQKLNLPILAGNALAYDPEVKKNPHLADGLVYFDYLVPGGQAFKQRYQSKYGVEPLLGSARAYDAVQLIAQSLVRCGSDREDVARCLRETTDYAGLIGKISFDTQGVIQGIDRNTSLFQVVDGAAVERAW